MNNWVEVSTEEVKLGVSIANLKKDELQFKYVKDITEKNKEIERLNNIINIKTDFIQELLEEIYASNDYELHTKAHLMGVDYEDKLKELKENNEC